MHNVKVTTEAVDLLRLNGEQTQRLVELVMLGEDSGRCANRTMKVVARKGFLYWIRIRIYESSGLRWVHALRMQGYTLNI